MPAQSTTKTGQAEAAARAVKDEFDEPLSTESIEMSAAVVAGLREQARELGVQGRQELREIVLNGRPDAKVAA